MKLRFFFRRKAFFESVKISAILPLLMVAVLTCKFFGHVNISILYFNHEGKKCVETGFCIIYVRRFSSFVLCHAKIHIAHACDPGV